MGDDDTELVRYIGYLQRSIVGEGASVTEDATRLASWRERSTEILLAQARSYPVRDPQALVSEYQGLMDAYQARTEFDSFHATHIFEQVLSDVLEACARIGIGPKNPVGWANNPSTAPSPVARPSESAQHLVFAGVGTFSFCSYWGKAFSNLLVSLSQLAAPAPLSQVDVPTMLATHRNLLALPEVDPILRTTRVVR